jgi:flagellar biosynthesis/type III secretory pathway chaperone
MDINQTWCTNYTAEGYYTFSRINSINMAFMKTSEIEARLRPFNVSNKMLCGNISLTNNKTNMLARQKQIQYSLLGRTAAGYQFY